MRFSRPRATIARVGAPLSVVPLLVFLAATLPACAGRADDGATATYRVERDTVGDTIVVRTRAGSLWADSLVLVEELRIGDPGAGDEYGFGYIDYMAVGRDGSIHVHDGAMKMLRVYDADGRYARRIGREGAGPGEFLTVDGLGLLPDGRLLVRDAKGDRLNVYTADGAPEASWPLRSGTYAGDIFRIDTAGVVYTPVSVRRPDAPRPELAYVTVVERRSASGEVLDTLVPPELPRGVDRGSYVPGFGMWRVHPHGYILSGVNDRYALELRRPGSRVLRIERVGLPAVEVPAEERAELTATRDEIRRRRPPIVRGDEPPPVPSTKPAFRYFRAGDDGRTWVMAHVPSVARSAEELAARGSVRQVRRWYEPEAWDVFEPDGRFLGRVHPPRRATVLVTRGEHAWGYVRDEDDVPYVVRWRIVPARAAPAAP